MPALRNPKWELFAQKLAAGESIIGAYVIAGYSEKKPSATRLAKNANISSRVSELLTEKANRMLTAEERSTQRAANALAIDKKWVMQELLETAKLGKERGELGPALRAAELIGKELGMFVQRTENLNLNADFNSLGSREAILEAVRKEFGDHLAQDLAALAAKPAVDPDVTPTAPESPPIESQSRSDYD